MQTMQIFPKQASADAIKTCFWCKKPKNETEKNGTPVILDYEPCPDCEKLWLEHIAMIGVTDKKTDMRPAITTVGQKKMYPTGRIIVLKESALDGYFPNMPESVKDNIKTEHKAFLDDAVLKQMQEAKRR